MKPIRLILLLTTISLIGCDFYRVNEKSKKDGGGSSGSSTFYSADCVCQHRDSGYINAHFFRKPFGADNLINKKINIQIPSVCRSLSACGDGFLERSGGSTTIKVEKIYSNSGYIYKFSLNGFPE